MRQIKRPAALLLALLLIFALLPFTEAQTGTVSKNTGTRHVVCTALSSQAQAYYTGQYTYANVSALTASATDPMNSAMFRRLHTLMTDTMTNSVSYNNLTNYWPSTDANNQSNTEIFIYSDSYYTGTNMSREHVWPKSHASFYLKNGGCDIHHLRPEDGTINSTRNSYTMGNVKGKLNSYQTKDYGDKTVLWYNTSGNGLVEFNNNVKGDVARILLYVWCRWEEKNLYEDISNPPVDDNDKGVIGDATEGYRSYNDRIDDDLYANNENDGVRVIESLETLLEWMAIDPVDTWEMSRNDQCEHVQGNRNVFIDYPEYAWLLFNQTPPSNYQTPSGIAMSQASYTITAQSNNNTWGSVSVSGNKVVAAPNSGYYAASATVSPATAATITRSGNAFTLSNITADCTVTVNFAAQTQVSVTFAANGGTGTMAAQTVNTGLYTLPACGFTAPSGQVFAGWKWSADNNTYPANATVVITAACTFTAQWKASAVTDTLTAADLAATSTSYTDFSNVSKPSGAVYAGRTAKTTSDAIQLRSSSSDSGIVTTASGGKVTKVTVTWNSSTPSGNVLDVYGKNSAYSSAGNL